MIRKIIVLALIALVAIASVPLLSNTESGVVEANVDRFPELTEIHDIKVSTAYHPPTGIKITRDSDDVVDLDEDLIIGERYNIRYKIVNEGNYNESVDITVNVENESWNETIGTIGR
jgi:hypothetical protein